MTKMAPTNFRTYEAQARLLAAVIATTNCKLDFKAIAEHIGSEATPSSVDHRLRPMKQLAKLQKQCLREGKDPSMLPIEKGEIQKLFGESTPAGLEYHFREVKATGRAQQAAVDSGSDPRNVRVGSYRAQKATGGGGSAPSTPATSRKRNAFTKTTANTTGGRNRKRTLDATPKAEVQSDVDSVEQDYDALDVGSELEILPDTPSARPRLRAAPPKDYAVNNSVHSESSDAPAPKRVRSGADAMQSFESITRGASHSDYPATVRGYGHGLSSTMANPTLPSFSRSIASDAHTYTNGVDSDDDDVALLPQGSLSRGGSGAGNNQPPSSAMERDEFAASDYDSIDLTQDDAPSFLEEA